MEKFIESSERERLAFLQMNSQLNLFNDCQISLTSSLGKEIYDGIMMRLEEGSIKSSYIMEFKVREFRTEMESQGFFLESKKLSDLKKLRERYIKEAYGNFDILYFNFTDKYTLVWNLTKLEESNKLYSGKRVMNKSTVLSKYDKVDKYIFYLKKEDAKIINFKWDEKYYIEYITPKEEVKEVIRRIGFTI